MNTINSKTGASYHMEAPEISDDAGKSIKTVFPVHEAVDAVISSNKSDVNVRRQTTIVKCGTLNAGLELNLKPDVKNLNIGAIVVICWTSDGTGRDVTVKNDGNALSSFSGTASKKVVKKLMWDGEGFIVL